VATVCRDYTAHSAGLTGSSHGAQGSSLQRTAGLTATLFVVIALFLAAAQLGGSALSAIQQGFQQNVTFTQKDFVPYSERLRCACWLWKTPPMRSRVCTAVRTHVRIEHAVADGHACTLAGSRQRYGSRTTLSRRQP